MQTAEVLPHLDYVLEGTDFEHLGEKSSGKVRDVYAQDVQGGRIIIVSTDRFTGFDRQLALVLFKGAVNTQLAQFWFEQTADIIPNHVLAVPDPNVLVAEKMTVLPVEMVVRGFITGVTNTALWKQYEQGRREFDGFTLPDGMHKNERLKQPVITPTTKFEAHDRPLSREEILGGMVTRSLWDEMCGAALALYERGQQVAAGRGLIIPDTKYEFGVNNDGGLRLIDEAHTPDSSRYWQLGTYQERMDNGQEPEYFDKEFLRIWFAERCDPYADEVLPAAPAQLVAELACRYVTIYKQLTGRAFHFDPTEPIGPRIEANLRPYRV